MPMFQGRKLSHARRAVAVVLALIVLLCATRAYAWYCQRTSGGDISCAFCFTTVLIQEEGQCTAWEGWCSDGWHATLWYC